MKEEYRVQSMKHPQYKLRRYTSGSWYASAEKGHSLRLNYAMDMLRHKDRLECILEYIENHVGFGRTWEWTVTLFDLAEEALGREEML